MQIKKTLSAVREAFVNFRNAFKAGVSTDELYCVFSDTLKSSLGDYQILLDYVWGRDTLNIDGVTKDYIPKQGDTVIMDVSVGKNGVWCDVTRSFFVGEPTKEQEETFELIKNSLRAGQKALKVGAKASDVYKAVNSVYEQRGKTLVHHAGHRIGEMALMQPQFLIDKEDALEVGNFYAIESGLYEQFGLRLENDYLLTENGAEDLFEELLPLDIKEYILK